MNDNGNIVEFNGAKATDSFNVKVKITGQTGNNGGIDGVETIVPLSHFLKTLEMPLINCEINPTLTWFPNCVIIYTNVANQNLSFEITEAKVFVPVITLSTQDNAKLLQQLKSGFKKAINWNKYFSTRMIITKSKSKSFS